MEHGAKVSREPTPVERSLVAAIQDHREEWPYIYVEMTKVTKDDLLADEMYCSRFKHPSMTNFYRDCGEIAGINISMLRKYERAGRLYEKCCEEDSDLPAVTDPSVCTLSPDTLALVDRISAYQDREKESYPRRRKSLSCMIARRLTSGKGPSRKQLLLWLNNLEFAESQGTLERALLQMRQMLTGSERVEGNNCSTANRRAKWEEKRGELWLSAPLLLMDGKWLTNTLKDKFDCSNAHFELHDWQSMRPEFGRYGGPDYVVVETITGEIRTHAIDLRPTASARSLFEADHAARTSGADCYWILTMEFETRSPDWASRTESAVGVMLIVDNEIEVLKAPDLVTPFVETRVQLYMEILARMMPRTPKLKDNASLLALQPD